MTLLADLATVRTLFITFTPVLCKRILVHNFGAGAVHGDLKPVSDANHGRNVSDRANRTTY